MADKAVDVDTAESLGHIAIYVWQIGGRVYVPQKGSGHHTCVIHLGYITVEVERSETDTKQLFQRFVVAGKETVDAHVLFEYKLSSYHTSLFDSSLLMDLPDKASLQATLIKKVPFYVISQYTDDVVYVLDGGALLQKLPWPSQQTYANLSNLYVQYVHRHYIYNHAVVVFDGYERGPSTIRETQAYSSISVQRSILNELTTKKKSFLANSKEKQKFVYFIGSELDKTGIKVQHSASDVDCNVVSTACTMAKRRSVTIVGDDTDLLVLMLHHLSPSDHDIFLQTASKIINIRILQDHVNPDVTASLFFLHALTGYDTASRQEHRKGDGNGQMWQGSCKRIPDTKSKP